MWAPLPVLPLLPEPVVGTGFHIPKGRLTTILPVAAAAFGAYLLCKYSGGKEDGRVNKTVDKDNPKVVHTIDMDELGDKVSYCRCWRSKKFPLCDGSHGQHNKETGDNVGPLVIRRRKQ